MHFDFVSSFEESSIKVEERKRLNQKIKSKDLGLNDINDNRMGVEGFDGDRSSSDYIVNGMTDTYVSAQTIQAALCATGIACRYVN